MIEAYLVGQEWDEEAVEEGREVGLLIYYIILYYITLYSIISY
jgi:hypothetical protein